jgi:hypothetical protein
MRNFCQGASSRSDGVGRRRFPVLSVVEPQPVSVDQLCLAHDPHYVRGVLSLRLANGFGNHLPEVAQSLPWTSGAMLGAARWALNEGCAVAPVAGFHHACHDHGGGYCTFNGLMVAAPQLGCPPGPDDRTLQWHQHAAAICTGRLPGSVRRPWRPNASMKSRNCAVIAPAPHRPVLIQRSMTRAVG